MRVLVIAPHPDDEVLGCGGTIHRLASRGDEVTVAIVTKGWEPLFSAEAVARDVEETRAAHQRLGVQETIFLDLPVTRLNEIPRHELNAAVDAVVADVKPNWLLLPFPGDRHVDHGEVFDAAMVAARPLPHRSFIERVLCYETISETHWSAPNVEPAFVPQLHVSIGEGGLEAKLMAMRAFESQCRPAPEARSLQALEALARFRGSVVGMTAAESFVVIRECW